MRTIADVIASLPPSINLPLLKAPAYRPSKQPGYCLGLATESMRRHMTNEGFEIFQGLEHNGYKLCGHNLPTNLTDVPKILDRYGYHVQTLVLNDKREWQGRTAGRGFDPRESFTNHLVLRDRDDIFKVTILKDAQHNPDYHRQAMEEIGCHAIVIYYHPKIVCHLAPYLREQHLIRTCHSLNSANVPIFGRVDSKGQHTQREGCILSGAVSRVYPLRERLTLGVHRLPKVDWLRHPGYGRNGCCTPAYLQTLSRYKVAICTSSIYGYLLRKVIEATACGCIVVTDLPKDEVIPEIDGNLVRVKSETTVEEMAKLLPRLYETYNPEQQELFSKLAIKRFDYREVGNRLAEDIETMRKEYNND